jgi:hypothetical protein
MLEKVIVSLSVRLLNRIFLLDENLLVVIQPVGLSCFVATCRYTNEEPVLMDHLDPDRQTDRQAGSSMFVPP